MALPGGEMLAWSDRRDGAGDRPLAALAARLVPAGARVLVAGPHDPVLLDALAHARLTCLLRGYPDAAAIADRVDRVLVAGPHGLPTGEEYDVVIAGAGLDAVESVEGERLGWDGLLARLVAALRPGGDLLLRVDNPLGVHRLVTATSWYAGRGDAEWTVGGVLDTSLPANLDQARARLATAGVPAGSCYAAYPRPDLTTALLSADQLSRPTASGLFDAVLHDACTEGFAGQFVLADPARLAVDALHAGRAAELAPSWLLLARRATDGPQSTRSEQPDSPLGGPDGLPVALVRAAAGGGVVEVLDEAHGWCWRRTDLGDRSGPTPTAYDGRPAAHRDPRGPQGPVPDGRLLRSLLLDGCLRRDTARLRRLLRGYAEWLDGQAERGQLTGAVALAGADNLVVAGDRFAVLDPSWRAGVGLPVDVVLARTLWRFATELLAGGYAHPWTSTLDVAGLTVVLGGVAGRDFDRAVVATAVQTDATVSVALRGPESDRRVDPDTETRPVPPTGPRSYQQMYETWLREREENTRLAALLRWTEELLNARERALRRAEAKINLLSGSLSYKVGRLAITPARMAKRGAGAAKRRAREAIAAKRQEQTKREQK
ncbi:hypothetical protein Xph01_55110 [Micromonospora phaseoli]|nr:hypothetical protein Xph01_55110 [Micromonospora phaseoli]